MSSIECLRPEMVWVNGEFRRGLEIGIASDGTIHSIEETSDSPTHDRIAVLHIVDLTSNFRPYGTLQLQGAELPNPDPGFTCIIYFFKIIREWDLSSTDRSKDLVWSFSELFAGLTGFV